MSEPNYVAVGDDADGWSVLDRANGMPAVLDGVPQVGLTQDEAREVAETLNAMTDDDDG